jgi:hypothetical protein
VKWERVMLLGPSSFYSICSIKGILVEILVVLNFFMFVSVHWRAAEGRKELKKNTLDGKKSDASIAHVAAACIYR